MFLFFTTKIISISMHLKFTIVKELTRMEYCYMNTPSLHYLMLLTSGGYKQQRVTSLIDTRSLCSYGGGNEHRPHLAVEELLGAAPVTTLLLLLLYYSCCSYWCSCTSIRPLPSQEADTMRPDSRQPRNTLCSLVRSTLESTPRD